MPGQKAPQRERREQILDAALRVAVARRLEGLTIRDVAREARLSSGLVSFHFKSRDGLIRALLDWMLQQNSVLQRSARPLAAAESLGDLIRDQCTWLSRNRERTELFFDFWVAGTRHPALRRGMRAALVRYRQTFRVVAAKALASSSRRERRATADAVAAAAVSFVHGCAIQAVMDPRHFQLDAALRVATALARGERTGRRRRSRRKSSTERLRRGTPSG